VKLAIRPCKGRSPACSGERPFQGRSLGSRLSQACGLGCKNRPFRPKNMGTRSFTALPGRAQDSFALPGLSSYAIPESRGGAALHPWLRSSRRSAAANRNQFEVNAGGYWARHRGHQALIAFFSLVLSNSLASYLHNTSASGLRVGRFQSDRSRRIVRRCRWPSTRSKSRWPTYWPDIAAPR
jgi:hypothetical protein